MRRSSKALRQQGEREMTGNGVLTECPRRMGQTATHELNSHTPPLVMADHTVVFNKPHAT